VKKRTYDPAKSKNAAIRRLEERERQFEYEWGYNPRFEFDETDNLYVCDRCADAYVYSRDPFAEHLCSDCRHQRMIDD